MVNDMTWRKFPRDFITNPDFAYISDCMRPEVKCAPYMFYCTAICMADDDGIFDLEDGTMFLRHMKIGTSEDLIKIANLMQQRRIITRVSKDSNRCILNDWDYPKQTKPRTMAERRQIVLRQIAEEVKLKKEIEQDFTTKDLHQPVEDLIPLDLSSPRESDVFLCPENDKKHENVVMEIIDDKIGENVGEKKQTEREKDREIETGTLERLEKKHTEEAPVLQGPITGPFRISAEDMAVAKNDQNEIDRMIEEIENQDESSDLILEAESKVTDSSYERMAAQIINDFFAKNCYGYNQKQARTHVNELVNRIMDLANSVNPPDVIAGVMLNEFKKMSETPGQHWYNTPLLPAYMVKDGVYSHILSRASRILLNNEATKKKWAAQAAFYSDNYESQIQDISVGIDEEYLKYGIDPTDPNRAAKLLQVKATGGKIE